MPQATHGFRISPRKALVGAAASWLGAIVVVWALRGGHALAFDRAGLLFWRDETLQPWGWSGLRSLALGLTALGSVLIRNLFALAAVGALAALRLRREAVLFALTVAGGWLVNSALKALVGRARPQVVPHLVEASGNSFPSGHSFNGAVVYIAMALAFAALSPRAGVRRSLIGAGVAVSLAIAWSRVWLGVHWPTDVVAGWLAGAGWALLASALLYRPAKKISDLSTPEPPSAR
jgi:undecaprenyl-diphosphatase